MGKSRQHAPLRVPAGWNGQDRALVIQLEKILDEVYSLLIRLGETADTAFPGDKGKTAYDHATDENRLTTETAEGLYKVGVTAEGHVSSATAAGRADIIGTGILHNGPDYTTAGQYALDAATGYTLSQSTNAVRKGLLKVAVKSGSDWKLPSGTNAAIGEYISVNGTLGEATAAITGGTTALVKNTNWQEVPEGILNEIHDDKADKVSGGTANNFAAIDAGGNLKDSGHKHSDYITSHQDISGKADKVSGATNNNFAALDASGNLKDSGHKHSDYLTEHQDISGKADKATTVTAVTYDSGNKKITKTINGTTTDVVSVSTIQGAMGAFTWGQLAGE